MSRKIFKESREELYSSAAAPSTSAQPAPSSRLSLPQPRPKRKTIVEQPNSPRETVAEILERRKTLKDRREELNSGVATSPIPARTELPSRLPRPPPKRKTIVEKLGSPRHAVARSAYSVDEFCWSNGFSRAQYYKLKARGEGPDEFRVGKRVLISLEAAARWRKQRTLSTRQAGAPQLGQTP